MGHESKGAVTAAIVGNTFVTIAKAVAFTMSGSAAMLSETLHSVADTFNQILLMVGIVRSERVANEAFEFGYGAERSVWALMSAVGIFFLGCGVTVYHGIHAVMHPTPMEGMVWALSVLGLSLVIEGAVLTIALKGQWRAANGRPFIKFLNQEADPSAVAVVLEDAAACLGVLIAFGGIMLAHFTGDAWWDGVASITIGLLLGAVAIWLIVRNSHLLVGPAIPAEDRETIQKIFEANPAVERLTRLRTRVMDASTYRVAAEVDFSGAALAKMLEAEIEAAWPEVKSYEDFSAFAAVFAEQVVEQVGDEVDKIEARIREAVPNAQFLDIEAD